MEVRCEVSSSSRFSFAEFPSSWFVRPSWPTSVVSPSRRRRRSSSLEDRASDVKVRCATPYASPSGEFGCGQCMPCRLNRRRLWTGRILLEATQHEQSSFLTLTYKDAPPELQPKDLQDFWKRMRFARGVPFRYFAVGEYGDQTWRPHYHAALFGVSVLEHELVEKSWGLGFVMLGDLTPASAAYIGGYVTKKMTARDDSRLEGKHPEFARMSLRPGIGKKAVDAFADALTQDAGARGLAKLPDVPKTIRIGGRQFPLGRYLARAMRAAVGWDPGAPVEVRKGLALQNYVETATVSDIELRKKKRQASLDSAKAKVKISRSKHRL